MGSSGWPSPMGHSPKGSAHRAGCWWRTPSAAPGQGSDDPGPASVQEVGPEAGLETGTAVVLLGQGLAASGWAEMWSRAVGRVGKAGQGQQDLSVDIRQGPDKKKQQYLVPIFPTACCCRCPRQPVCPGVISGYFGWGSWFHLSLSTTVHSYFFSEVPQPPLSIGLLKNCFAYLLLPYLLPNICHVNFPPPRTLISYMNWSDFGINDAIIYYTESINKLIMLCLVCL